MSEIADSSVEIPVSLGVGEVIDFTCPSFCFTEKPVKLDGHTPEPNQAIIIYAREKLFNVFPVSTEIASGQSDDTRLFSIEHTFGKLGYYTLYAESGGKKTSDRSVFVLNYLIAIALMGGIGYLIYYMLKKKGKK